MSNEVGAMHNKIVPRKFEDLRGWIDALRDEGELQEIDVEVDWDCELGTVARKPSARATARHFCSITSPVTARATMSIPAAYSPAVCRITNASP